jgi:N6-L-threonylcarbamoyladenine synthase
MLNYILAIDTSCDDTSVSVVSGTVVHSNVVASQAQLHKEFGGVFPTVAKQEHKLRLPATVKLALKRAGITEKELAAVAVTQGPGLAPALEVGITFAKELSQRLGVPCIPVNHIEGHVVSVLAEPKKKSGSDSSDRQRLGLASPLRPALALVISGGHSEFIIVRSIGQYERVGWTVDDAAGEALDKFGRMIDLGYPAGPVVEEFAKKGDHKAFVFPLPMTTSGDFNMSFSGLKTAARNKIEALSGEKKLTQQDIYDLCASFQFAVFRAITYKLNKYLANWYKEENNPEFSGVWLGGGVAANMALRRHIRATIKPYKLTLRTPYTKKLCGDNAAMIGLAAALRYPTIHTNLSTTNIAFEREPNQKIDHKNV